MKTKTLPQVADLQTASDYLAMVARKLRDAGEPGLFMSVEALRSKVEQVRNLTVVK